MEISEQFDDIRPYQDAEVNVAIGRLMKHPGFKGVLDYLFEGKDIQALSKKIRSAESVESFQKLFSYPTVESIVRKTSSGLTHSGAEGLKSNRPYLFIANHRDIVLDAAIMQYLLARHGYKTSQITFSENLMMDQLLMDLGKLNKMFTFFRGGSKISQYRNAIINSAYINYVLKEKKESIWIAQRNGRTKNGDDRTQTGLIKMLSLGSEQICDSLAGLNIVPVSISYEREPCDIHKVRELYMDRRAKYVKAPKEDLMSILSGITGDKGRIHFTFGRVLNPFLKGLEKEGLHDNEAIERITGEIDRQIHSAYKLWPSSYIAADLLEGSERFNAHYSDEESKEFKAVMDMKLSTLKGMDPKETSEIFLNIYANPIYNCHSKA